MALDWLVLFVVAANVALFSVLLGMSLRLSRDNVHRPVMSRGLQILALICVVFIIGNLQRLGIQGVRLDLLSDEAAQFLLGPAQTVLGVSATITVIIALVFGLVIRKRLVTTDLTVSVMTEGRGNIVAATEIGLTAREYEILEAIFSGALTNEELAERLYVSTSTVSSHVSSIMAKAGVSTRRELLLLTRHQEDSS